MKGSYVGNMDRRITLQSRTASTDGWGGQDESWGDIATVWAAYKPAPMTGLALTNMSEQPQFIEKATFIIRFRNDVTTDMRISYNGAYWKVIGMAEMGRKDRLQIAAVKTDSDTLD